MDNTKKNCEKLKMNNTKGIILAGGSGSRLYPSTLSVSKQLLPVHDKPMIYYPLSTLMLAGVKDILIITTQEDNERFKKLLKDGSQWGVSISYAVQNKPNGIAEAIIISENFIKDNKFILILGDNIFYGNNLISIMNEAMRIKNGATIFAYSVKNPNRYGVVELNSEGKPIKLIEKPEKTKSTLAVTGIYFYDKTAIELAKKLKPSSRGEYEITELNKMYLEEKRLNVQIMGRGYAWFDAGTHSSLLEASQFIATIENRQNFKIACPEEIAFNNKYINKEQLLNIANHYKDNEYSKYLHKIIEEIY